MGFGPRIDDTCNSALHVASTSLRTALVDADFAAVVVASVIVQRTRLTCGLTRDLRASAVLCGAPTAPEFVLQPDVFTTVVLE